MQGDDDRRSADITRLLHAAQTGHDRASDELLPLVYEELRRRAAILMAREAPGQTLQATALVHEAYVRIAGAEADWEGRRHFFNAAARAMCRLLIDRARRPGRGVRSDIENIEVPAATEFGLARLERVDAAIDELGKHNERWAEVIRLRYFAGLSLEQTAATLRISIATVKSDAKFARAWLHWRLTSSESSVEP